MLTTTTDIDELLLTTQSTTIVALSGTGLEGFKQPRFIKSALIPSNYKIASKASQTLSSGSAHPTTLSVSQTPILPLSLYETIPPSLTPTITTSTNIQEIPSTSSPPKLKPSKRIERTNSFRIIDSPVDYNIPCSLISSSTSTTPQPTSSIGHSDLSSLDPAMTRSRSGSFYCPLEPAWAPLSISQKAQISTALPPTSSVPALTERPPRRHTRTPSFCIGSDEFQQCTLSSQHSPLSHRSEPRPLFLSTPNLSSTYGFGTNAAPSVSIPTLPPRKRHAHSPARPSPLCGETVPAKPAQPLCLSAMWPSHAHGHGTHHQRTHSSVNSSCSTLHRSVLKSAFMAGPMARKARMYGLRVAWCVFGDARVEMARDIFGRSSTSSGIVGGGMEGVEVQHTESVSVEMPVHDMAFEWEQSRPSASQDSYSYLEIDQQDSESDSDSTTSSDSDYEAMSDEETDSAESDDLDDEDEIHREVLAAFHQASLDSSPELGKHPQAANDGSRWEVLTFEG